MVALADPTRDKRTVGMQIFRVQGIKPLEKSVGIGSDAVGFDTGWLVQVPVPYIKRLTSQFG